MTLTAELLAPWTPSRFTLYRAVAALEAAGLITVERPPGRPLIINLATRRSSPPSRRRAARHRQRPTSRRGDDLNEEMSRFD